MRLLPFEESSVLGFDRLLAASPASEDNGYPIGILKGRIQSSIGESAKRGRNREAGASVRGSQRW